MTTPSTLAEELVERTRLSWLQVAAAIGLVSMLLLVGAAYLDGALAGPFNAELWRNATVNPALVVYMLLILPILRRLREGAIHAFRPLEALDADDFHHLLSEAALFNRRREWVAMGIGVVGGLALNRPWTYYSTSWLRLYGVLSVGMLYGLGGWFVYYSLAGTTLFNQLHRHPLAIGVFELKSLEAVARWSLGIALTYVGGITLSLLFLGRLNLGVELIIIYGTFVLVPVLVFFLNMMSTHRVMVETKERELKMVRGCLAAASQMLNQQAAEKGPPEETDTLLAHIAAWVAYENRVNEVREWPYTQSIMRSLVASILLPLAIFLLQGVLFELILRRLASP